MKLLKCVCKQKQCSSNLKILNSEDDLETSGKKHFKDSEIELMIFSEQGTQTIIVNKQELIDLLKE